MGMNHHQPRREVRRERGEAPFEQGHQSGRPGDVNDQLEQNVPRPGAFQWRQGRKRQHEPGRRDREIDELSQSPRRNGVERSVDPLRVLPERVGKVCRRDDLHTGVGVVLPHEGPAVQCPVDLKAGTRIEPREVRAEEKGDHRPDEGDPHLPIPIGTTRQPVAATPCADGISVAVREFPFHPEVPARIRARRDPPHGCPRGFDGQTA